MGAWGHHDQAFTPVERSAGRPESPAHILKPLVVICWAHRDNAVHGGKGKPMFWSRHGGRRSGRHYSLAPDIDPDVPGAGPPGQAGGVAVAVVIAVAVTLSRHAASMLSEVGSADHLLGVLLDAMLTVPVAAAASWLA